MVRRTKRRGGMLRSLGRPVGRATVTLGESIGKDYLQKKSVKVAQGLYDDPSLASNPRFILTGNKQPIQPNIRINLNNKENNKENINTNIPMNWNKTSENKYGGRSRRRTRRRYKKIKTRKSIK
jgi:hypothetical protein